MNPQVSILCLDAVQRRSCRTLRGTCIVTSGGLLEDIRKELATRKIDVKSVIKVAVDEVEVS